MDLTGIISISGVSGLSKVIAKTKNGFVCESLIDKKRFPVQGTEKVSALADISIYTYEGEKPLKEVFALIKQKENGKPVSIDIKSDGEKLKSYLKQVLPNFDQERVYNSDIKKLLTWYNILLANNLLSEVEEAKEEKKDAEVKKPAKKAAAKKAKTESSDEEKPKKPAKKAAAKKAKKAGE